MTGAGWARRIRGSSYGAQAITRYTSRAAVALMGIVSVSGVIAVTRRVRLRRDMIGCIVRAPQL